MGNAGYWWYHVEYGNAHGTYSSSATWYFRSRTVPRIAYLTNSQPQFRFFKIRRRLVISTQESCGDWCRSIVQLSGLEEPCKDGSNFLRIVDLGRVLWWTGDDEVIAEEIVYF